MACSTLVVTLGLVACQSTGLRGDPATRVDALRLVTTPSAQNFDGKPGADGFLVKVYALSQLDPKAIPITSGRIEIALFEGVLTGGIPEGRKPERTWQFDAETLPSHASRSFVGIGYTFSVRWDEDTPKTGDLTLLARYLDSDGREVTTAPVAHTLPRR